MSTKFREDFPVYPSTLSNILCNFPVSMFTAEGHDAMAEGSAFKAGGSEEALQVWGWAKLRILVHSDASKFYFQFRVIFDNIYNK